MFKVGDRIFITRGSHQNETGVIASIDSWAGTMNVRVDGWPGEYSVNPAACFLVLSAHDNKKAKRSVPACS